MILKIFCFFFFFFFQAEDGIRDRHVTGVQTCALPISTTTFALLDAMRHPFVPYPEPERAFTVWLRAGTSWPQQNVLAPEFELLQSARTMSVAAVGAPQCTIADVGGRARTLSAARVTPNMFQVLGVRPQLGRDLS